MIFFTVVYRKEVVQGNSGLPSFGGLPSYRNSIILLDAGRELGYDAFGSLIAGKEIGRRALRYDGQDGASAFARGGLERSVPFCETNPNYFGRKTAFM